MRVALASATPLRFADGSPVRAASAVVALDGGWLVLQDDGTHACWTDLTGSGERVRVLAPVAGRDVFGEADGTKHLKPDLEIACAVPGGALLLGSGSTPARMRAVLLRDRTSPPVVADLSRWYAAVARALDVEPDGLDLEGACVVGDVLRVFDRGLPARGKPSRSIDVGLGSLLDAVRGGTHDVVLGAVRRVDLGDDLAVTDATALGADRVLVSAVAEATSTTYDDGPVSACGLALLEAGVVRSVVDLPRVAGRVVKVEGLAVLDQTPDGVRLLAVVDADDPEVASSLLVLDVDLGDGSAQREE